MKREGRGGGAPESAADVAAEGGASARAPLARLLEPAIDEARIAQAWQRLRTAEAAGAAAPRRPSWARWLMVPAGLAAVAAAWLLWLRPATDRGMLRAVDTQVSLAAGAELSAEPGPAAPGAAAGAGKTIALRDGSRLRLERGARLQVLENDGQRFVAALRHGPVRVEVKPGERRWTIETELASIEVIGTAFVVAHEEHVVRVAVEHGVVMVRGERVPGRVVRLVEGQELVVSERGAELAVAKEAAKEAGAAAPPIPDPSAGPTPIPTRIPTPTPIPTRTPTPSASTGTAPADPAHGSVPSPPRSAGSMGKALQQADQLRQAGEEQAAASLLEETLRQLPDDPAAGMIEHSLGRLYLDRLGDPARAARMFAAVVQRGTPPSLVEGATARHCEALWKAGDREAAAAAFAEYQRRYPEGNWHAALSTLLATP